MVQCCSLQVRQRQETLLFWDDALNILFSEWLDTPDVQNPEMKPAEDVQTHFRLLQTIISNRLLFKKR